MDEPMQIVRAEPADFLAIAALDAQAWPTARARIPDGEHTWRLWCEHADVWIAREGGATEAAVVGVLLCFPGRGELDLLHKVFVDPRYRGQGVASQLMERFLAHATRPALLTVDPANVSARRVYERFGFRAEREVAGYYRPEEDRLVMIWRPNP